MRSSRAPGSIFRVRGTRKEKRFPELDNHARSLKGEQPCALVRRTHRDERHD